MPKVKDPEVTTTSATRPKTESPRVCVRYNADAQQWSVVDPKTGQPSRSFDHGVMTDVEFRTVEVKNVVRLGCASETRHSTVGVANGVLYEETFGKDFSGWKNLSFKGSSFVDENGHELTKARKLRLMPDRRALYKL